MKFLNLAVGLVALAFVSKSAAEVLELTDYNFEKVVNGDNNVFVKFFAPWCGHCKAMAEDYIALADAFTKYRHVIIAEVDADKYGALAASYDVSGYPTLKFFPKGSTEGEDYTQGRGLKDMLAYVNGKAGTAATVTSTPSAVTVLNPKNFALIIKKPNVGKLVEFYAPWCGHCKKLAPIYEKVAKTFTNEENVIIANCDLAAHRDLGVPYEVQGFPTLKWFPVGCSGPGCAQEYSGKRDGDDIVAFINDEMGTKRVFGGGLTEEAGRHPVLDSYVSKFMAGDEKEAVIGKATEVLEEDSKDSIQSYYVKIMQKLFKLNDEDAEEKWVRAEIKRLEGMADKPVAAAKKDEFAKRKNILQQFHNEL